MDVLSSHTEQENAPQKDAIQNLPKNFTGNSLKRPKFQWEQNGIFEVCLFTMSNLAKLKIA